MKRIFAVTCAGLLMAGCAPKLIKLESQFATTATTSRTATGAAASCQIVTSVEDGRTDDDIKAGFGWLIVQSPDAIAWLRSGVMSMQSDRYQLVLPEKHEALVAAQQYSMQVKLRKMYILGLATSKSSTIVVSADLFDKQGQPVSQTTARGTDTSVNWTFSEGEINSAFHTALEQVLEKMDKYVEGQCKKTNAA